MGVLGKSRRAKMKLDRHRAAALEAMLQAAQQEKKGFDFSQVIANAQAYQPKLLEVTQANMTFFFPTSARDLRGQGRRLNFWASL